MTALIAYYWFWLLLAFLVGLATAWWRWGQTPRTGDWDNRGGILDMRGMARAPHRPDAPHEAAISADTDGAASNKTAASEHLDADDLTRIKGIDAQMAGMLRLNGVSRYSQIADWSDTDAEQMSVLLGTNPGQIMDGQWIEQARLLAAGNGAEFESRFGHL